MPAGTQLVTFPAAGGGPRLAGVLHLPGSPVPHPAAVVCHPHSMMGGTMDSAVVVAVCRALAAQGWAGLRFDFRGAGRSAGSFDEGRGEMDDVAGALDFLYTRPEVDGRRLAVVGYSFGAGVGLHYAATNGRPRWMVGIALVQAQYADPFLDADPRPKLLIGGAHDPWAPPEPLRAYVARLQPPATLRIIQGTDHFFTGHESELAGIAVDWLKDQDKPQQT